MSGCQMLPLVQSQSGACIIAPLKSHLSRDFFDFDFLHNAASGNKMPQVLSRLLSEIHVNIFTRRLQGISLRSQA